uniref:CCDC174 alpha/beta GRSR domain-containing protein n=1 Tax=Timema monikensis TaxID=170555 RepID=A0A7R9EIE7_9NEOP|nr:unnamed protein product [Timema monikensis]
MVKSMSPGKKETVITVPVIMVEYTDILGRTRKALRRDLPFLKEKDAKLAISLGHGKDTEELRAVPSEVTTREEVQGETLEMMSSDMKREMMRQKWEEQEAVLRDKADIHYQDVLFDGTSSLGRECVLVGTSSLGRECALAGTSSLGRECALAGTSSLGRECALVGTSSLGRECALAGTISLGRECALAGTSSLGRECALAGTSSRKRLFFKSFIVTIRFITTRLRILSTANMAATRSSNDVILTKKRCYSPTQPDIIGSVSRNLRAIKEVHPHLLGRVENHLGETTHSAPRTGSNPVFGSLVRHESSALDHATTEASKDEPSKVTIHDVTGSSPVDSLVLTDSSQLTYDSRHFDRQK